MCLACEDKLYGVVRVIYDFVEAFQVVEKQVGTFICREAASEPYYQGIGVHIVQYGYNLRWVLLGFQPIVFELRLYILYQFVFLYNTCMPNLFVGYVVYLFPYLEVRLVVVELFGESVLV